MKHDTKYLSGQLWIYVRGIVFAGCITSVGCGTQFHTSTPRRANGSAQVKKNPKLDYIDASVIHAPIYVDGPVPIPGEEPRVPVVIGTKGVPVLVTSMRPGSLVSFNSQDASPPRQALMRRHRNPGDASSGEVPIFVPLTSSSPKKSLSKTPSVSFEIPQVPTGVYDIWYEGGKPNGGPPDGGEDTVRPSPKASQWLTLDVRAALRAESSVMRGDVGSIVDIAIGVVGAGEPAHPIEVKLGGFDKVAQLPSGQSDTVTTGRDGRAHFKARIAARGDTYIHAKSEGYSSVAIRIVGGPVFERSDRRLQPGDILECQGDGILSPAIMIGERFELKTPNPLGRPWYSHVAIYLGNGEVAEMLDKGLMRHTLDESVHDCTTVDVYRRNGILPSQQAKVVESIRSYGEKEDVPYAKEQIKAMAAATAIGMNLQAKQSPTGSFLCGLTLGISCGLQNVVQSGFKAALRRSMNKYVASDQGRQRMICSELATWAYRDAEAEFNATPYWPDVVSSGLLRSPDAMVDFTTPNMISHSRDIDFLFQVWPPGPPAFIAGAQIMLGEQVTFDLGSAEIRKDAEELLHHVVELLERHPEVEHVNVEGHTDDVGDATENQRLSERRADVVKKWFVAQRIDPSRISSAGLGQSHPLVPNNEEHNRRRNRRVEFHIVPKPRK